MESHEYPEMFRRDDLARAGDPQLVFPTANAPDRRVMLWEQVVRILRKNAKLVLCVAGTVILCVAGGALYMKDVYQTTGRLEVDPLDSGIKTLHEIQDTSVTSDQDYLETQVQVLQSEALAMRVIRLLHLEQNKEFVSKKSLSASNRLAIAAIPVPVLAGNANYWQEQVDLANRTPAESAALDVFRKHLGVNPVRNSRLIEVSYESHDPRLAQFVTNTLMAQFLEQSYRDRFTTTMEASEWLSAQLSDLRRKVDQSSQAVADYQKRYGIVEEGDHDVPLTQLMAEVNHQLSDAQASRIEAEASVRMIDMGYAEAIPDLRDDSVYQGLLTHYADAQAELAQARVTYGDENSNVKKLLSQEAELSSQLDAERYRVSGRLRASLAAAQERERMMVQSREKLRGEMGDVNAHLVEYGVLRNEAAASAELYNTLQARLKEAGIYAGLRSSNIHVVDMAPKLEKPSGPARELIVGFGILIGGFIAILLAFLRESFDNTIRTPDDISQWIGLPSLAMVPTIGRAAYQADATARLVKDEVGSPALPKALPSFPKIHWTHSPNAAAEALRGLRTSLLISRPNGQPHVILVSSPSAGEGKTTVAVNLAMVLAQRGKVCIVDGDFRRPMVASAFGMTSSAGLSDVLTGSSALEQVLTPAPNVPGLSLLPGVRVSENPTDLVASDKLRDLIVTLKSQFDFVVIDSSPMIPFSDARLLAPLSDAVVLVGRYGITTRTALARCAQLLEGVHAREVGVVLNDIDQASPDYHYYNYGFSRVQRYDPYKQYSQKELAASSRGKSDPGSKAMGAHA
jgi:succinoglycan biosynthesis transport protein ExoP